MGFRQALSQQWNAFQLRWFLFGLPVKSFRRQSKTALKRFSRLCRQDPEDPRLLPSAVKLSCQLLSDAQFSRLKSGDLEHSAADFAAILLLDKDSDIDAKGRLEKALGNEVAKAFAHLAEEQEAMVREFGSDSDPVELKTAELDKDFFGDSLLEVMDHLIVRWPILGATGYAGQAMILEQHATAILVMTSIALVRNDQAELAAECYGATRLIGGQPISEVYLWTAPHLARRAAALARDYQVTATFGDIFRELEIKLPSS